MSEKNRLIWFSGRECVHCKRLRPLIEEIQEETDIEITELEVWHNDENAQLMREHGDVIKKACGGELGVPAFYNERTGKAICGMVSREKIEEWATE